MAFVVRLGSLAAASNLLVDTDFENGSYAGWGTASLCCAHSARVVSLPAIETKSLRLYLNSEDPCTDPAYCSNRNTSDRAELARRNGGPGRIHWYALSIYLDQSFRQNDLDPNGLLFSQWHPGDRAISPYLLIAIKNNTWYVRSEVPTRRDYSAGAIQLGKWTRFVVFLKCSAGVDGVLNVWRDGSQLVSKTGPNTYSFPRQFPEDLFKFGMYKSYWKNNVPPPTTFIAYFDDVRIGDEHATFDEMNNTGAPAPALPPAAPVVKPPQVVTTPPPIIRPPSGTFTPPQPPSTPPAAPAKVSLAPWILGLGALLLLVVISD